ncbi:MAG TPA: small ribosomal subunit Rsm22 family protein [Haliangiales bacterium]|nr:small ribosomal subunit Rsm22 family protein [Haliangiales bacterium]
MTWEELEDFLWEAAPPVETARLLAAVAERTHRYTDERERLAAPVPARDRDRDLAARAVFFTLADAPKVGVPLAELETRGLVPAAEPLRVLDAGAGCGALTYGTLAALPGRTLEVTAVDQDRGALDLFARVAARLPLTLHAVAGDATRALPAGPFDICLAGSLLNELAEDARLPLVAALVARLRPGGAVILVEPALRDETRALHRLRDAILRDRIAHVFAPCTHEGGCPALANPRDWCHEDRPFSPPPRLRQLAARLGLRRGGLKFAYLTLRAEPGTIADGALRIVSGPLDQKGTIERIGCGASGWVRLRALKRHKPATLGDARRGDLLHPDGRRERIISRP